jgi:hypothetical protein
MPHTIPIPPRPSFSGHFSVQESYSDSRGHGTQGPTRNVRIPRTASSGASAIAKNEDDSRCVVAGIDCELRVASIRPSNAHSKWPSALRILRVLQPSQSSAETAYKTAVGRGGVRIESSRNLWEGSGLKIDSANTDVAWGHGSAYPMSFFYAAFLIILPMYASFQQQDIDQRTKWRIHHVGYQQGVWEQVRCVPPLPPFKVSTVTTIPQSVNPRFTCDLSTKSPYLSSSRTTPSQVPLTQTFAYGFVIHLSSPVDVFLLTALGPTRHEQTRN